VASTNIEFEDRVLTSSRSPKAGENRQNLLSTLVVHHIAKKYGVNVKDILGTSKYGRVLKEYVFKYVNFEKRILYEIYPIFKAT
jgi:hypothetical protein